MLGIRIRSAVIGSPSHFRLGLGRRPRLSSVPLLLSGSSPSRLAAFAAQRVGGATVARPPGLGVADWRRRDGAAQRSVGKLARAFLPLGSFIQKTRPNRRGRSATFDYRRRLSPNYGPRTRKSAFSRSRAGRHHSVATAARTPRRRWRSFPTCLIFIDAYSAQRIERRRIKLELPTWSVGGRCGGAGSGKRARSASADGEYSTPATRAAAVETCNRVYESVTLSQLRCLAL